MNAKAAPASRGGAGGSSFLNGGGGSAAAAATAAAAALKGGGGGGGYSGGAGGRTGTAAAAASYLDASVKQFVAQSGVHSGNGEIHITFAPGPTPGAGLAGLPAFAGLYARARRA